MTHHSGLATGDPREGLLVRVRVGNGGVLSLLVSKK